MQLFLTTAPEHLQEASRFTGRLAHGAYRVDPKGRLLSHMLPTQSKGSLMVLSDQACGPISDSAALCRDIWRECTRRNYFGVVADFELPISRDRSTFLLDLSHMLRRNGKTLFVPEHYARQIPLASVLICTALSGGTLRQRLEEACRAYGHQRLALDLQRLRMSFSLPCPTGEGKALTEEQMQLLLTKHAPFIFYSADLCAKYFTFTTQGQYRFVLFDDADTLLRKIRIGGELNIKTGFLLYTEVRDILPQLLR